MLMLRQYLTTGIEIAGATSITVGSGLQFGLPVGLIVGGVLAIVFSYFASDDFGDEV